MRPAIGPLRSSPIAAGLAIVTFLLLTLSVQFCLAVASPSGTSPVVRTYSHPSYAYVTPAPHP